MLKAAKKKGLVADSLARGIEHLYLMDGTNTIFYMYERTPTGEIELLQVQMFCPELYELTVKRGEWIEADENEIDALLQAQCQLLQRTANLLKTMR